MIFYDHLGMGLGYHHQLISNTSSRSERSDLGGPSNPSGSSGSGASGSGSSSGPTSLASMNRYCELIYAFLQDSDSCRLTYTHFTARVQWESTMEVLFNRPVYISPNKSYKIVVVLNKVGRYPVFSALQEVVVDGTVFNFGDNPRVGLIKSLIFANANDAASPGNHIPWEF